METFAIWLLMVGLYRVFMSFLILIQTDVLKKVIYPLKPIEVSPLFCRMAFMWVISNAILTITTSLNMDNKPLYFITWLTFVIGLSHFMLEQFYFKTNTLKSNLSQLFFATPCLVIMGIKLLNW
ncbi:hypothetical protein DDB_G0289065 [Dictyostelium discoideum AX4]|uniref:Ergosterol biosynthetic protein 28 homolog n=1 Tax=Dictyostelium discoideum TaxID=44689 RepID=Q54I19_DICDI|nr:hypothetical protein DDB_G0289065 [Dictyostelium discoideum AX4]EAL62911.1 hypothetical protein DDB_G0289065 [Dictyostelium discoideum AX4]|eukprot:XP_636415.1 hypothetical protein DDB_G0289065 [Dictyostelium discoideum AX4]